MVKIIKGLTDEKLARISEKAEKEGVLKEYSYQDYIENYLSIYAISTFDVTDTERNQSCNERIMLATLLISDNKLYKAFVKEYSKHNIRYNLKNNSDVYEQSIKKVIRKYFNDNTSRAMAIIKNYGTQPDNEELYFAQIAVQIMNCALAIFHDPERFSQAQVAATLWKTIKDHPEVKNGTLSMVGRP